MKFTVVTLLALLCLNVNAADISRETDEALEAAANQLIAEGGRIETKTIRSLVPESASDSESVSATESESVTESEKKRSNSATASAAASETENKKESEIPLTTEVKAASKTESNVAWRMIASLGVVLVVAGTAAVVGKKYRRHKDKGGQKARIEMMHQLHLGPKKSIGLIRVAGEAILIGITDNNINMLKSVALIDDELENIAGKNFNNFLEEEFSIEDVRDALSSRA
jgi:flagellar biogenesis protein FliO